MRNYTSNLSAPSQHLLELAFPHVFKNEFEKREIYGYTTQDVFYQSDTIFGFSSSSGKVAIVLTKNSKGEYQKFKMFYSDSKGYCYCEIPMDTKLAEA